MIERNNPEIDVDDLMLRVQVEAARSRCGLDAAAQFGVPTPNVETTAFDTQLGIAEQRAAARRSWSGRLNVFPFNRLGWLRAIALRAFNFFFRDQRHVNFALIAAARELHQMNRELSERVSALEARLHELQPHTDADSQAGDG